MTKQISGRTREAVECAIARGARNSFLMAAYDLTYQQLATIKEVMSDGTREARDPRPRRRAVPEVAVVKRTLKPCGTEAAWRRHTQEERERCEPCRVAHAEFLDRDLRRVEKRRRAA